MAQTALRCSGITFGGSKCANTTTNPSGLCAKHENARVVNQDLAPMASSQALRPVNSSPTSPRSESWKKAMSPQVSLRIEQEIVADKAFDAFINEGKDRVQVRAACGMGKTIMEQATILKYDDHLQDTEGRSGNYLFVVPSISLANQMARDIQNDGVIQGLEHDEESSDNSDILIVHNESKQFSGTSDKDESHKKIIADFMEKESDAPKIVITVVNSIDKVIAGQNSSDQRFDIAMFDEAHNYSTALDGPVKGKTKNKKSILPIYFDEQKDSIQSDNRMFFTATPRMKSKLERPDYQLRGGFGNDEGLKNNILALSENGAGVGMNIYQDGNTPEVFGEHIGNWGYRHAIMSQYLTKAEFHSNVVMAKGRDLAHTTDITRDTKVDAHGNATDNPNDLSFGSYMSMKSIADSVANQGSRNVLSFLNSIDECKESKRNWEQYLLDLAESKNGRRFMSDDDARVAIISGTDDQKIAGKYYLMARHSSITYSSSKSTESEKQEAEEFFDKEEIGDRAKCTCGKPAGWCACARIVHNVDMFSEGISIKSIDTVVLNRPSYSSDANINQAIGRASRKMKGKKTGKVIMPRGVAQIAGSGKDEWARPVEDTPYVKSLRAVSRIWNDVDGNYIENNDSPLSTYQESLSIHDMSSNDVPDYFTPQHDIESESVQVTLSTGGNSEGSAITAMVWDTALSSARGEWDKNHKPSQRFSDLPRSQQESLARSKRMDAAVSLSKTLKDSQVKQALDILDYRGLDDYDAAKIHLDTQERQAKAGEFGYTLHQQADIWKKRAKQRAPRANENVFVEKSGFPAEQWDALWDRFFSQE